MLKGDLIAELASRFPKIYKNDLKFLIDAFFSGLAEGIKTGHVEIRGFGVFTSYLKKSQEIKHPIFKKTFKTQPRRIIRFRPTFKL
jgi:nucleoid DNA-binding protein